jgi:hypothetical protein
MDYRFTGCHHFLVFWLQNNVKSAIALPSQRQLEVVEVVPVSVLARVQLAPCA